MDYVALGRQIREARKRQKKTQEMVAEKTEISTSFLGHIERGTRKASVETLVRLCDELQISTDEALGRTKLETPAAKAAYARDLLRHALEMAGVFEDMCRSDSRI